VNFCFADGSVHGLTRNGNQFNAAGLVPPGSDPYQFTVPVPTNMPGWTALQNSSGRADEGLVDFSQLGF
jgi:hypothetical protein